MTKRMFWPVHATVRSFTYVAPDEAVIRAEQARLQVMLYEALRHAQPFYLDADRMTQREADRVRAQFVNTWWLLYGEPAPAVVHGERSS